MTGRARFDKGAVVDLVQSLWPLFRERTPRDAAMLKACDLTERFLAKAYERGVAEERERIKAMPCYLTFRAHGSPLTCDRHDELGTRPRAEPCPRCAAIRARTPSPACEEE